MIEKIKNLNKDQLVRGSMTLFVMLGMFNLLNYLFQMSMARMLGPADYGILAVLMSILYIFSIPNEAIQTIISRYASRYDINKEDGKTKDLLFRSLKRGLLFSSIAFGLFIPLSFFLESLLDIEFWLLGMVGIFLFFTFSVPIVRGVLQGRKKFFSLGMNMVAESSAKVILALVLVFSGMRVYGALGGVILASAVGFVIACVHIRKVISKKREAGSFEGIYRYNLPVLVGVSAVVLIYSFDVIMARVLFSPEIAGVYAFVSLIAKVPLFLSFSISKTLFPLSSEKFEQGKKTAQFLRKAVKFVLIISVFMLLLCLAFPEQLIRIVSLGSSEYLGAANILFIVSLAFSFTAFTNVLLIYGLSINKIRKLALPLLLFVVLEITALSIFRGSLIEFSIALLVVNFAMFLYCLLIVRR